MEPSQTSSPSQILEGPWGRAGVVAAEESIKLIPKIRPSTTPGLPDYVKYVGHKALTLSAPGAENAHWDFDFVASPHTRQSSFFRVAGRPMADHFLAFYNAAIIAYGQTGSGKTHTMLGSLPSDWTTRNLASGCFEDMPREAGLIPRVLGYIFQRVAADSNGGATHKQPIGAAGTRQLPQPPPTSLQSCTTPEHTRPRVGRSGIPTPTGVPPRAGYLTPPLASPQRTLEPAPGQKLPPGPSSRIKPPNTGGTEYLIKASMLQIYQEVVTDLLNPRPVRLQIRESMEGGVMVVGLSEITVRSAAEALQLLRVGTSHRAVAETASNPVSSRSHCILTLHMEAKDKMDTGVVRIRRSRLQLVDLAGSERSVKGADYGSARQKETNAINKSLSTLGLVISRLTDRTRSQGPVPYRDSKLTFLLQDCLGGNAKTLIIANLNPSPTCSAETNMTLGFALRAKRVRNRAVVNEDHQGDAVLLQGEVRRLREELSIFRTLHAKDGPPQGIEELSVWRDQAAARVSQLHQALQLNGELEEKLAQMEAAHSRLRMEHAVLEEQCEAQRCEMSALEATVEQCEDELHELRTRPTLEQLQDVEAALGQALHERDEAQAQHAEVVEQNLQLQDECAQLTEMLEAYQRHSHLLEAEPAELRPEHDEYTASTDGADDEVPEVARHSVEEQDYSGLAVAYTELKSSYAALVEQNCELLQQLQGAVSTLEAASAKDDSSVEVIEEASRGPASLGYIGQRHRYYLAESCLISGGLEAVMESADEFYDDECRDMKTRKTRALALAVRSPSEHVRLASPMSAGGGACGQEAASAPLNDDVGHPSPPPPSPSGYPEDGPRDQANLSSSKMRKRSRTNGHDGDAGGIAGGAGGCAAPAAPMSDNRRSVFVSAARRRSLPGFFMDDIAPACMTASSLRRPGWLRQVQSARDVEDHRAAIRHGDNDDAAESRSLGTLVRVNPLFECRSNGEDQPRAAEDAGEDEAEGVAEVTSALRKFSGSGEGTAGSDSLVCELPMPPDEQITVSSPLANEPLALPWCNGGMGLCNTDDGSDSTAGTVHEADEMEDGCEASIISDARDRTLQEIQNQSPSASVVAVVELLQGKEAGLQVESSLMATPCSHPKAIDTQGQGAKSLGQSPSRGVADGSGANSCESPESQESMLGGFVGSAVAALEAALTVSQGINRMKHPPRSPVRGPSPLLTFSVSNAENIPVLAMINSNTNRSVNSGIPRGPLGDMDKRSPLGVSNTAQSPCVTGVSGPSPLAVRSVRSASRNASGRSRIGNIAAPVSIRSPTPSTCTVVGCIEPGGSQVGTPVRVSNTSLSSRSTGCRSAGASPVSTNAGVSWICEDQLVENVAQLEDELARRLQGEMQLRIKLQEALTEGQSAAVQAANLLALNNGMVEEISERDERLRGYEELVSQLYSELKTILRQGLHESETPVHHTCIKSTGSSASPGVRTTVEAPSISALADSEPVTISPTERPRVIQSFETGVRSALSFGTGSGASRCSQAHFLASGSASASPPDSHRSLTDDKFRSSPLRHLIGSGQLGRSSSAMKTGLMVLLAKLRDGLLDRDQRVAVLEEDLVESQSRLQRMETELQKLQDAWQQAIAQPGTEWGDFTPTTLGEIPDTNMQVAIDTSDGGAVIDPVCVDEHGFIAPPSPACSDPDPHPSAPWSASRNQPGVPSPLESSLRRESNLQAQLHSRDCQVFELLERNEQLETSLQAILVDRDSRIAEIQTHAARLAGNLQSHLWRRDTQVSELQSQVAELDLSLQRTTAEAVRFRQQMTEAAEQCERYALELRGLERREELLMNKLRALEMSLLHRAQEMELLRAELSNTLEQLSGMRTKAMAAEVEAAHARQAAASLEDQLEDLQRKMGLLQKPQLPHRPQSLGEPPPYMVATIRPTGSGAGVTHPAPWPQGGQGAHLPYIYTARSDGSTVEGPSLAPSLAPSIGPSMAYQMSGPSQIDYGPSMTHHEMPSGVPGGARSLGQPIRTMTYSQAAPPAAGGKAGLSHGYLKGSGSRGYASVSATTGTDHGAANKGTWVQRFLCRKGVSVDGSPGQEAHVAILTPAKWRTKTMTGIVLRQWVGNGSRKNTQRRGG